MKKRQNQHKTATYSKLATKKTQISNKMGINKTGTNLKSPLKRKDEETIDHGHKEKKEQIWRTKGGDQNNKGRKNES